MATSTPNFGLYKYEGNDAPDLTKLSTSMDKIDTELKKNETNIGLLHKTLMSPSTDHLQNAKDIFAQIPLASSQMGVVITSNTMMGWLAYKWVADGGSVILYGRDIKLKQYQVIAGVWSLA